MASQYSASRHILIHSALWRAAGFFIFWLVLAGSDPANLAAGLLATALTVWASLRLTPPAPDQLSIIRLARFIVHFVWQANRAGFDVAMRALSPRLRIQPGFVRYQPHLPPGAKRDAFCTETSLLPGTLPAGTAEDGSLLIHCLDVTQPVIEQLAQEETLFMQLFKERTSP